MDVLQNRRLAVILFADIAGYTAMMEKDERSAAIKLRKFQQQIQDLTSLSNGKIVNFYGDGALCTFDNSLDAINAAIRMTKSFSEHFNTEPVPVRIGLHTGTVVFENNKIYGNSVNITSRIESMGIPGAVLVSKNLRDDLRNYKELAFQSLGNFEFKNIEKPIEVFAIAIEGFVVPKKSELKGKLKTKSNPYKLVLAAILPLLLLFLISRFNQNNENSKLSLKLGAIAPKENSLAILPLKNLSPKDDNYFAEGMHDDLITYLSKLKDIKVISRNSVLPFRDSSLPLSKIAKILKVQNILDGSIRISGEHIRINIRLINTIKDENIWSNSYDVEVNTENIFSIQSEIASAISEALNQTFHKKEGNNFNNNPTKNLEAYEAYLRARQLLDKRNNNSLVEAQSLLEKAVRLDPDFALAYIHLATVHYLLPYYSVANESNFKIGKDYLDKGMAIQDNLVEAYALKGFILAEEGNMKRATEAFEKAIAINPNYPSTYHWYARAVHLHEQDFEKEYLIHQKAMELNPLSPVLITNLGMIYQNLGQYEKAKETFRNCINIEPEYFSTWRHLANNYSFQSKLDSAALVIQEGITNTKNNNYLKLYLSNAFLLMDMGEELNTFLNSFDQTNQLENTIYHASKLSYELYINKNIQKADDLEKKLASMDKIPNEYNDFKINMPLYKRDWKAIIKNYESNYPKDNFSHLKRGQLIEIKEFQDYLFALKKTGSAEKAKTLWKLRGQQALTKPKDKDESMTNFLQGKYLKLRALILADKNEQALFAFEELFKDGFAYPWQHIEIDPFFDELKNQDRFILQLQELRKFIEDQKISFKETNLALLQ